MAAQFDELFMRLPRRLRLRVWDHVLLSPGVHFVRPNSDYNGTILLPASDNGQLEYGLGSRRFRTFPHPVSMQDCSWFREMQERVQEMIDSRGMVRIALNPRMAGPDPKRQITAVNRPHIVVDLVNDIFVFSSFHSKWFPNYYFSGSITTAHPVLKDIKILGINMPQCNRDLDYFICKDCGKDYTNDQEEFLDRVEFCRDCMSSWTAQFQDVELVYLMVPGVRRARIGDKIKVYRYGPTSAIDATFDALDAMPQQPSYTCRPVGHANMDALGERPAVKLEALRTTETLGPEGPRCYHGAGITLFEVPSDEVPSKARKVMRVMFKESFYMRSRFAIDEEEFSPCPSNPRHCGGNVEFRFMSFEAKSP